MGVAISFSGLSMNTFEPSAEMPANVAAAPLFPPLGLTERIVVVVPLARSYTSMPSSVSDASSDSAVWKYTFEPSLELAVVGGDSWCCSRRSGRPTGASSTPPERW